MNMKGRNCWAVGSRKDIIWPLILRNRQKLGSLGKDTTSTTSSYIVHIAAHQY